MAVLKNWDRRNKFFEIQSGSWRDVESGGSYQGFGFKKEGDFFGTYKEGNRLLLCVNEKVLDVDKDLCAVKYSNNPLFERVRISSGSKEIFKKTYWLLGKRLNVEQPMDAIDEDQQFFFPWLKKVVERKISFQIK